MAQEPVNRIRHWKILKSELDMIIIQFIRSLLATGIQPSHGVILGAIVALKLAQNPHKKPPTERWFRLWWKSNKLHKIKTNVTTTQRMKMMRMKD